MELRQLEYFVAVADEANFTRAAERLHVAQPGVSAQVKRLEAELGQELLDRSGRRVTLTEVGAAVLPHARAALAAAGGVRATADELSGLVRGRATLGVVEPVAIGTLDHIDLLARFHAAHPGVEISLIEAGTDALVEGLRDGSIDLAFAGFGASDPDGIEVLVVATTELVAAVAPGDPLVGRKQVRLAELAGRDLVGMARGTGLRRILDEACAAIGVQPRVAFEASDPHVVASIAARGLGVAIVPAGLADAYPGVEVVPIRRPRMRGRLALAWRAGGPASPAGRALLALARDAVSDR